MNRGLFHSLVNIAQEMGSTVVACSGGVDSLLLGTIFNRFCDQPVVVVHAVSPAVPRAATLRVREWADGEGWQLKLVSTGEFNDEEYLSNPVNRCYYCKSHLYSVLASIAEAKNAVGGGRHTVVSGANTDDLSEYRPGLEAAREFGVRHPYVEVGIDKAAIREIARHLLLPFSELPAAPCLASRIYTDTRVTERRLAAIEQGEIFLREAAGLDVVRCRIRGDLMAVEVGEDERSKVCPSILSQLEAKVTSILPEICEVTLDSQPYRPGRAFAVSS